MEIQTSNSSAPSMNLAPQTEQSNDPDAKGQVVEAPRKRDPAGNVIPFISTEEPEMAINVVVAPILPDNIGKASVQEESKQPDQGAGSTTLLTAHGRRLKYSKASERPSERLG